MADVPEAFEGMMNFNVFELTIGDQSCLMTAIGEPGTQPEDIVAYYQARFRGCRSARILLSLLGLSEEAATNLSEYADTLLIQGTIPTRAMLEQCLRNGLS